MRQDNNGSCQLDWFNVFTYKKKAPLSYGLLKEGSEDKVGFKLDFKDGLDQKSTAWLTACFSMDLWAKNGV